LKALAYQPDTLASRVLDAGRVTARLRDSYAHSLRVARTPVANPGDPDRLLQYARGLIASIQVRGRSDPPHIGLRLLADHIGTLAQRRANRPAALLRDLLRQRLQLAQHAVQALNVKRLLRHGRLQRNRPAEASLKRGLGIVLDVSTAIPSGSDGSLRMRAERT